MRSGPVLTFVQVPHCTVTQLLLQWALTRRSSTHYLLFFLSLTWILLVTATIFCLPPAMDHSAQGQQLAACDRTVVACFFTTTGGTSFVSHAIGLPYPFAPSCRLSSCHCTFNLQPQPGHSDGSLRADREHHCWLALGVIWHNCSTAAEKNDWSLV